MYDLVSTSSRKRLQEVLASVEDMSKQYALLLISLYRVVTCQQAEQLCCGKASPGDAIGDI